MRGADNKDRLQFDKFRWRWEDVQQRDCRSLDVLVKLARMDTPIRYVDPRELRVPASRPAADPVKLTRQISQFGASLDGMPPLAVYEDADGLFLIYTGVTLATRAAKLAPDSSVPIEVYGKLRRSIAKFAHDQREFVVISSTQHLRRSRSTTQPRVSGVLAAPPWVSIPLNFVNREAVTQTVGRPLCNPFRVGEP